MSGYSLEYILDSLTLPQLMLIHSHGIEFEETRAIILLNKYAEALSGKSKKEISDKPDIAKFKRVYGNKIKTFKDLKKK